jgi:hypothetical protein
LKALLPSVQFFCLNTYFVKRSILASIHAPWDEWRDIRSKALQQRFDVTWRQGIAGVLSKPRSNF